MRTLLVRVVLAAAVCAAVAGSTLASDCVTLNYPADNATGIPRVNDTVTLKWNAVSGATGYDIYFGAAGAACSAGPVATETGTQFTPPPGLTENTQYEWKVVANGVGACAVPTCAHFTTASCPTDPPTLIEPIWGEVPFGNVTFKWNTVTNALGYELWVAVDGDPPFLTGTTTSNQKTITLGAGRYIDWYVIAKAPSCDGVESSHEMFTTSCPTTPASLQLPNDNTSIPAGSAVNFKWTAVSGAASYDVKVSPDAGNSWFVIGPDIHGLTFSTNTLEPGTYLWEVRANFDGSCEPLYSDARQLTITAGCNNSAPNLVSPENGSTHTSPVFFKWGATANAKQYRLYVQKQGGTRTLLTSTDHTSFTATLEDGTYEWGVLAVFEGCDDLESAHNTLIVSSSACPSGVATLVDPGDGETNVANPIRFEWQAVDSAIGYRVIASLDGGAPFVLDTTTDTRIETSLDATHVTWSVQTLFGNNCEPTTSPASSFTMKQSSGCPSNPGRATLTSPANAATNLASPVTFKWNAVSGAVGYRILARLQGESEAISLGLTTKTTLTADLPAGTHEWAVQTFFGDQCPTTLSDPRTLTVTQGAQCNTTPPTLIAPADGASNVASPVTFTWSAVPGANNYRLWVAFGDDNFEFYGETEGTSLARLVPKGTIRWAVVAELAACPDVRSATSTFTVTDGTSCPDASIDLLTPADNATVASPVHLTWTAVADAVGYRVWASTGDSAPAAIARTTAPEATVSLPAGAVGWRVEALRSECNSVVSDDGHFTVQQGANCGNNAAPSLVSPLSGTVENPVKFTWSAAANAIAYRLWIARDAQPFQDIALTRDTNASAELEGGHYKWFVEAIYEGCNPVASPQAEFVVEREQLDCGVAPTPISPEQDAIESSPVTFRWSEVEDAVKYRVFVAVDDEEPMLLGSTEDTQLERPLPPGHIVWSVEAVFDECPSAFSPRVAFTIPRSQNCPDAKAELVAPSNGASDVAPSVDFAWNAVSGAIRYALVVEVDDGSPTLLASTASTHVTRRVPAGSHIEWWVLSFFASCEPTQSDEFEFDVAAENASCPTRAPLLLLPAHDGPPVSSPVHFVWVGLSQATGYRVWAWQGEDEPSIIASTNGREATAALAAGTYNAYVEALFDGCQSTQSAPVEFTVSGEVACGTPRKPEAQVVGQALSNTTYNVRWTPLPNVSIYELQESTSLDFATATTFTTSDISKRFTHEVTGAPVQYLYRVRGVSGCNDSRGAYSDVVGVFVVKANTNNSSAELGDNDTVVQTVFLRGSTTPLQFAVTTDKPWLHVTPATGTLPPEGITLTVTADPGVLALGTNTGTIHVSYSGAGKGSVANGTTTSVVPISVSLVTPVTPGGKSAPPPDSLIFPVAGHAVGVNDSLFESDIRITNLGAQTMKYQINFTPSGTDGTQTGSSSTIEIAPNGTIALDDIVSSVFGTGTSSSALGMLEVRPLTTTSSAPAPIFSSATSSLVKQLTTAASSRTYNFTPNGTFGQYIPAIPFSHFVGQSQILSLQQVAQSAAYRANFGFAEASGQAVNLNVRVYDTANHLLATIPVALGPSEHKQVNGMLAANGITNLTDGRVEVEVTGGNGKVTAYVSEIDNQTNDPLLVTAEPKGSITSDRYVVPGMAYIDNGFAFWVSDLRIFNAGTTSTPATLTFYPQGNPTAAVSKDITLDAGEVEVLDNVVNTLFGMPNGAGGAIAITTPTATTLTATARTYNQTTHGTYGQYVPGVTPAQSVGLGDRPLQILQLEQSSRFRTNVGLSETTGQPVTVQVSVIIPDSLATPVVDIPLQANEFRQISLAEFGLSDAYNARVTVKVIGGAGRVTAYGSAIDVTTQDPTFVPPQ